MIFRPLIAADMSGSMGGITYSHNKGGAYARIRAIPTNPNTILQQAVRSVLAQLTQMWNTTLTAAQRADWQTYADNVQVINRIGASRLLSGISHYVRSNTPRLYNGFTVVNDAPTIFDLGDFTLPSVTYSAAAGNYSVAFDDADAWCDEDGSLLFAYASREQNPTINYFKGPYQALGYVAGNSTTPPTSPASMPAVFALTEGNKGFLRFNVSRADGRLSLTARTFCVAAA